MQKILKYSIKEPGSFTELVLPIQSEIVSVGAQGPAFCLWALIDDDALMAETHKIYVTGTGIPLPEDMRFEYIGRITSGPYEWHVLEVQ